MAVSGLHTKLVKVMDGVSRIKKNGYNSFHKYSYVTEADVIEAVKTELVKQGLSLTQSVKSFSQSGDITTVLVDYTITDADTGEACVSTCIGAGQDKGDKGPYKALTGSMKYFLMKSLLIPTGDDPEASDGDGKSTAAKTPPDSKPAAPAAEGSKKPMVSFSKKALTKAAAPAAGDDI